MKFTDDYSAAARRLLKAAQALYVPPEPPESSRGTGKDVAGYLYGIAAECAVKHLVSGIEFPKKDEILGKHFPLLRTRLRDAMQGRVASPVLHIVNDESFLSEWNINVRYAKAEEIQTEWVNSWATQAREVVKRLEAF